MQFEPRSITFHIAAMNVIGSGVAFMDTASPELEGVFRIPNGGGHGTVSVPLDEYERAFLKEIVRSASRRAIELIDDAIRARPI